MSPLRANTFLLALCLSTSGCLTPVGDTPLGVLDAGFDAGPRPDSGQPGDAGTGLLDGGQLLPLSCNANTWCWQYPLPQGQPLHAVFSVSASEAWAGGDFGALLRFTNGTWQALTPVTDYSFEKVWGPNSNELWAIGRKRLDSSNDTLRLFHFDGTTLRQVDHGPNLYVNDITGSSASNVWLHTSPSTTNLPKTLQRWNGTAFVPAPALPARDLEPESICVRSETEAWATVSDGLNSSPIALYRYDGSAWSLVHRLASGSSRRFNSAVACPEDGVAVVQVFEFNTGTYSTLEARGGQVTFASSAPSAVFKRTPHGELFSVAGAQVSRWTSTGWQPRFTLAGGDSVYGVDFDFVPGTTLGWLANGTPSLSSWVVPSGFVQMAPVLPAMRASVHLRSLNPTDPTAVFGSGAWGLKTATGWTFFETPLVSAGTRLSVVDSYVLAEGRAWLVGNGVARYELGTAVTLETGLPQDLQLTDIDGSDDSTVWAVGANATVLRLNGQRWETVVSPVPAQLDMAGTLNEVDFTAVDVRSANDVVVLGNHPAGGRFASVFFKWDGSVWSVLTWQFGTTLTMFARDSVGDLYTVDGNELKKRAVGASTWVTLATLPGFVTRLKVYGPNDIELVARTETGLGLFRWDIDRQAFSLEGRELQCNGAQDIVPGAPTTSGQSTFWAFGAFGGVLRYEPQ